jgi:hypothetical protein
MYERAKEKEVCVIADTKKIISVELERTFYSDN